MTSRNKGVLREVETGTVVLPGGGNTEVLLEVDRDEPVMVAWGFEDVPSADLTVAETRRYDNAEDAVSVRWSMRSGQSEATIMYQAFVARG